MKKTILFAILVSLATVTMAQKQDTVIVPLANTSKVIFTMKDRSDLATLKHYNFQALFDDILAKIEKSDTAKLPGTDTTIHVTTKDEEDWSSHDNNNDNNNDNGDDDDDDWDDNHGRHHEKGNRRTRQSFNIDLGTNNFLSSGKFPDSNDEQYAVRPWGSWYVGLNSIQRTRLAKKFFLEWGGGISWYNFKFQDDATLITKDAIRTNFIVDPRSADPDYDFKKSKLTAVYINASVIPVLDFGSKYHVHNRKGKHMWDGQSNGFRIGAGPYIGYRIDSYSKQVFELNGDKKKERDHDSFYLQNIRYGMRLQLGYRGTDLFLNYDLNEMFTAGKGPKVNAFSFGIIL
ncbi:MAG: hypothetical protein ABI663_01630 [Chryseolinea sp.]